MAENIENWLPVCDHYQVSDLGRVWSNRAGIVLKPGRYPSGHFMVNIHRGNSRAVHVLVLEAFVGQRPDGMWALHRDDDKGHNALANLYWGTPSQNQLDRVTNGIHSGAIKTHCKRDHELTGDNLLPGPLRIGKRQCRECARASQREWARRRRS